MRETVCSSIVLTNLPAPRGREQGRGDEDLARRGRQFYLKALLREKYHHLPHLGSCAFREGEAKIQNLDLGIKILISFNVNAVLMCECGDPKKCHRLLIAQELWNKGFEAEELKD